MRKYMVLFALILVLQSGCGGEKETLAPINPLAFSSPLFRLCSDEGVPHDDTHYLFQAVDVTRRNPECGVVVQAYVNRKADEPLFVIRCGFENVSGKMGKKYEMAYTISLLNGLYDPLRWAQGEQPLAEINDNMVIDVSDCSKGGNSYYSKSTWIVSKAIQVHRRTPGCFEMSEIKAEGEGKDASMTLTCKDKEGRLFETTYTVPEVEEKFQVFQKEQRRVIKNRRMGKSG
ncbi:MAG TPA: hypothetical protein QF468_09590 [Nitrospinota bacterium]|nr:hypothetical protein [Nitrospinota bacterium]